MLTTRNQNLKGFIMKTRYAILPTLLMIFLALQLLGQQNHGMTKVDMKKHDMSKMMGKPTVDATVEGIHMKVWLMTQKHHKKMMKENMGHMKEMKHDGMGMKDTSMALNKATKEAMMAGTHHIMLTVTDAASGKEIPNASANVLIVSPSTMHSTVDLKPMMNHFGCGVTLAEKGKYTITVGVTMKGITKTKEFQYSVK
jgi:hypothetical protein